VQCDAGKQRVRIQKGKRACDVDVGGCEYKYRPWPGRANLKEKKKKGGGGSRENKKRKVINQNRGKCGVLDFVIDSFRNQCGR